MTWGWGWGAITAFVRRMLMKHSIINVHNALPLLLQGFGSNPEDWHQLMFGVLVNVGVLIVLCAKVFVALIPQKLHSWIYVAGKWEGINLSLKPDVVKVWSNV
jgi:hypothetical protein